MFYYQLYKFFDEKKFTNFLTKKNLFAMDPTQFVNCSKKARVDWLKEMLQKYDRVASKHVYDICWIYAYVPNVSSCRLYGYFKVN